MLEAKSALREEVNSVHTRMRAATAGTTHAHYFSFSTLVVLRLHTPRGRDLTFFACRPARGLVGKARWRLWLAAPGFPAASCCQGQVSVTAAQGPECRFSPLGRGGTRMLLRSRPEPVRCQQPARAHRGAPSVGSGEGTHRAAPEKQLVKITACGGNDGVSAFLLFRELGLLP